MMAKKKDNRETVTTTAAVEIPADVKRAARANPAIAFSNTVAGSEKWCKCATRSSWHLVAEWVRTNPESRIRSGRMVHTICGGLVRNYDMFPNVRAMLDRRAASESGDAGTEVAEITETEQ